MVVLKGPGRSLETWRSMSKVLVFGDVMEDVWLTAATPRRVSPEAPVPVHEVTERIELPGGAANVSRNLLAQGVEAWLCVHGQSIPRKTRLLVNGRQVMRYDEHDWCEALPLPRWLSEAKANAVVISDYAKGAITPEFVDALYEEFYGAVYVDTKRPEELFGKLSAHNLQRTMFFPNYLEHDLHQAFYYKKAWSYVLKMGKEGLSFRCGVPRVQRDVPAMARRIESVAGAGDSVLAGFIAAHMRGTVDPLLWAACSGAVACEHPYTYAPTTEEVEELYVQTADQDVTLTQPHRQGLGRGGSNCQHPVLLRKAPVAA